MLEPLILTTLIVATPTGAAASAGAQVAALNARPWSVEVHQTNLFVLPPDSAEGLLRLVSEVPSLTFGYVIGSTWKLTAGVDWFHGAYSDERHYRVLGLRAEAQYHFTGGEHWSTYALGGVGLAQEREFSHHQEGNDPHHFAVPRLHAGLGLAAFSGLLIAGIEARAVGMVRFGDSERAPTVVAPQVDLFGGVRF